MQPLFKKKRSRPQPSASTTSSSSTASQQASRRDDGNDSGEDEAGPSVVVTKQRKLDSSNPLVSSTGISLAKRNRLAAQQEAADDEALSLLEDEYSSVTARAKASGSSTSAGATSNRDNATRGADWYDEAEGTSRRSGSPNAAPPPKVNNDDGVYRGLSAYSSASASKGAAITSSKTAQRGPIRAPNNIRTVTVMDYQPDVCKDYKETGYCGFGDTCKFLHDRSDYLAGWQMEAAYMPNSSARNLGEDDAAQDLDDEEEEIPFACLLCRQPFTDPIVTRCGHYFCSGCAIKRYAKTPKCFACGAQTGGIFNSATKIIERMEKRRRGKEEERKEKAKGWGRENGEGEEGGEQEFLEGVEIGGGDEEE
ncbi:hypothetical protein BDZ90DRAFT_234357 [Jaminaea rosea]|uniref:Pre-mRNA-splicing factor CWC24 n=1 Tax=Jaminaea rosea TaxID=1569628 RepID=A0A316UIV5_9BASI|nr:hypothetical protein BDZ90DRAFT_234357 [Jaminaea rosea]PWN25149.1 hypothetical protein BDZ90DRAFT_234357 [Jaminaea rosea]